VRNIKLTYTEIDFLAEILREYQARETYLMNYTDDLNSCIEILKKLGN